MHYVPDQSITLTSISEEDGQVVAIFHEELETRYDEAGFTPRPFATEPTEEEVIAAYLADNVIYPTSARDVTQVTIQGDGETFSASVVQWNWMRTVQDNTLVIPREALPEAYTTEDLIAWGRANRGLITG